MSVLARWRRPSGDGGHGVENAEEALKGEVFSLGAPGVDVNRKGSLGDMLVGIMAVVYEEKKLVPQERVQQPIFEHAPVPRRDR